MNTTEDQNEVTFKTDDQPIATFTTQLSGSALSALDQVQVVPEPGMVEIMPGQSIPETELAEIINECNKEQSAPAPVTVDIPTEIVNPISVSPVVPVATDGFLDGATESPVSTAPSKTKGTRGAPRKEFNFPAKGTGARFTAADLSKDNPTVCYLVVRKRINEALANKTIAVVGKSHSGKAGAPGAIYAYSDEIAPAS